MTSGAPTSRIAFIEKTDFELIRRLSVKTREGLLPGTEEWALQGAIPYAKTEISGAITGIGT